MNQSMISEAAYLQQLNSCAAFNKRLNEQRRHAFPFFDQQTGIAQQPTTHLVKNATDRCPIKSSFEAYRYKAHKWKKVGDNSDALEFQHIVDSDPTLKAAVDSLANKIHSNVSLQNESLDDSITSRLSNGRTNFESLNFDDNEHDDLDQDLSDEDEYGDKKRRRRRAGTKDVSFKGGFRRGGGYSTNNSPGLNAIDVRPFVCQECGARYKSRPGLTYHRLHSHEKAKNQNTISL